MEFTTYLPEMSGITKGIRKGRNVYEGYQRGWGLQYGSLRERVLADPLYEEAYAAARDRTIMSEQNRMNIFLLMRFFLDKLPFGHIVEYGSYRGGGAIFMAYVAKRLYPGMKVFALDTYEGMPLTDKDVDAHNIGNFSDTDIDSLQARVDELHLDNLVLVKGLFENTNDMVMERAGKIIMAHIDCDIASAVRFSYEGVKPHMVEGGYIVFDDATVSSCIGATEVVEEVIISRDRMKSEQIWPHFVFRAFSKSNVTHTTGMDRSEGYIAEQLSMSKDVMAEMLSSNVLQQRLSEAAHACITSLQLGGKILLAGNGGSAADAQHIAAEFVSRFAFDRPGLSAISLSTDTSILTAIGNDYGYETLFARQVQAHGKKGDVLIVYTTSGRSKNILNALCEAREQGLVTIGFTGNRGGEIVSLCDYLLEVPSADTPHIQEGHAVLGHILCGLVEQAVFGERNSNRNNSR